MFKIGDLSRLSQVSIKALRYYDKCGLLKPAQVDGFTGYRYYSASQLPRLNRILAFKDLGFSLEQISALLDENLSPEQMRGMLRMRQAEIHQRVSQEQSRLQRVEARLRQIEQENEMSDVEVVIKHIEPLRVAALRGIAPNYGGQCALWGELEGFLAAQGVKAVGPCLTIYHDDEYRERDVDIEVCEPVDKPLPAHSSIKVYELPAVESMATMLMAGAYDGFGQAYGNLIHWIEANGYRICGPNREVYLHGVEHTQNPAEYLTEIQIPVVKL